MKWQKTLFGFMKGNCLKYLGAVLSIGASEIFAIAVPMTIAVTMDSIIGDSPINVPFWMENIIEFLGGKSVLSHNLWICALLLVAFTLGRGVFMFLKGALSSQASESIAKNMREDLYDHIQHLPYDYHVKSEAGDLIQRCTSDVDMIRRFLQGQLTEIGRAIFILVFSTIVMCSLNVKLTLISVVFVPAIFIYSFTFFSKIKGIFKDVDESEARMTTVLQENLSGVRVVRAFGRQKFEVDKFDNANEEYRSLSNKLYNVRGTYWALSDFMCMMQTGLVLMGGSYFVLKGEMTVGVLVAFLSYVGRLLWPVRQLGRILSDMGKMTVSISRIQHIFDQPIERVDEKESKPEIKGNIKFKNVHFQYDENMPILDDVSFNVEKGETVAIMGPTGSGKSSLVHLLARLYDYQGGNIEIDGHELRDINKKWIRKNVGIVLQEPFLYSKTIKENIGIACKELSDKKIFDSADMASVHKVIMDFENGYETMVGEKGVTLSGGQRQRVAIARTLINSTPILIFDDSLSAVDTETDASIRKALRERSKDVTTFIISHRISTLMEADKIIVLEDGKISQSGTHKELIEEEGLYKRVWDIQRASEVQSELVS